MGGLGLLSAAECIDLEAEQKVPLENWKLEGKVRASGKAPVVPPPVRSVFVGGQHRVPVTGDLKSNTPQSTSRSAGRPEVH